jgi:ribonuclease HI
VFWGEDHQDNLSISLGIGQHTNNKTEILAIIHALEIAIQRGYKNVIIRTDSELIVKSMNNWLDISLIL